MAIFLVDYENVNAAGLHGIDQLIPEDEVLLFYTEKAATLPISLHKKINASKARTDYFEVGSGAKNSLDFQLASYLGYLVAKDPKSEYYIVSRDTGFRAVKEFWVKRDIKVDLAMNLLKHSTAIIESKLKEMIPQYADDIPLVRELMERYKTKQGLNNALIKEYGSEKTGILYKAIKPLLADKKGR
jgi:hypothetical protein